MSDARPAIEDVIADMNDDALAETIVDISVEGKRLLRMADLAEHELIKRLVERGATVLDTDHWDGRLSPGLPNHDIDTDKLLALEALVSADIWAQVRVQPPAPPPRWDKRALNELAKRGGEIRATIEAATTTERGRPRLELKRKEAE